ncbi:MAG: hypothetical protein M1598_02350 [Actinobacteria bacterium]|nr:hypothetical protein [Actinomycetota bacterium]
MSMVTDPRKIRKTDPGRPEVCTVFSYFQVFGDGVAPEVEGGCRSARICCVACKEKASEILAARLAPIRERRREIAEKAGYLEEIVHEGSLRARRVAQKTLEEVRAKMGMDYRFTEGRTTERGGGCYPARAQAGQAVSRHVQPVQGGQGVNRHFDPVQDAADLIGRRRAFASGFTGREFESSAPLREMPQKGGLLGC